MNTPTIHFNLDNDLRVAVEMADGLVPYIYSEPVYGAMPQTMPRLTVGGLFMRLNRLNAIRALLSSTQQERLDQAQAKFDSVRREWAVAYEGKLDKEIALRLHAYQNLLQECAEDSRRAYDVYPAEIDKRVMLEGLLSEATRLNVLKDEHAQAIKGMDTALKSYIVSTPFIWDSRLEPAYPKETFWCLYGRVAVRGDLY
jgi:hypothetical protein